MKQHSSSSQSEILISLVDIWRVIKDKRKIILVCALLGACISFYYVITKPITYVASATFKEKTSSSSQMGSGTMQMLFGSVLEDGSGSAISLMQSELIMKRVVENLGLQAQLSENAPRRNSWKTIFQNLKVKRALKSGNTIAVGNCFVPSECVLDEEDIGVSCKNIHYESEYSLPLNITFVSEDRFQVRNSNRLVGEYLVGEPVLSDYFRFCLLKNHSKSLDKAQFTLLLLPMKAIANSLARDISIKKDKTDKSLLLITYEHSNRHLAAGVVNELMLSYKNYLKEENKRVVEQQIAYLEKRQEEASKKVEEIMKTHAQYLKDNIDDGGFVELTKELEFVGDMQGALKERILKIDLELALLENKDIETYVYSSSLEDESLAKLLVNRQELEGKRDFLSFGLLQGEKNTDYSKELFAGQLVNLEEIESYALEIDQLETLLLNKESVGFRYPHSTTNFHPVIVSWLDQLNGLGSELERVVHSDKVSVELNERLVSYKEKLLNYLKGYKKLLGMQKKFAEEHLAKINKDKSEFQGISLGMAESIYEGYNEQRDEIQKDIRAYSIVLENLKEDKFDVSSFSSVLRDTPMQGLLADTLDLVELSYDGNNRSPKEQERLKHEHRSKKEFLLEHIKQSKDLLLLEESRLRDKLIALQHTTLDIVQNQLSAILEQFQSYRDSRKHALGQERLLIQGELKKLQERITHLPEKWMAEKRINMHVLNSTAVVQELTKLIEAKNIASNLNKVESTPLDYAVSPSFPKYASFGISVFVGAFIGALLMCIILGISTVFRGVRVSEENLLLMGQRVAGHLFGSKHTSSSRHDFHVVRKIMMFLSESKMPPSRGKTIAIIQEEDTCSSLLAYLLTKKQEKVLVINCSLLKTHQKDEASMKDSLLDYLNASIETPLKYGLSQGYDYIYGGKYSPYAVELLQSKRFLVYLDSLKEQYDWILLTLPLVPTSHEALVFKDFADQTVVVLHHEKLHEITPYIEKVEDLPSKISFVLS
ncbi:MAG: Wzz/FepE/Etk N-terminal domain-containing protein [Chlamydiales bacterium]|nr:Wzz/FepE/Etk N-terminal domain-containing protein [Chlamydiales bacterium]